MAAAVATRESHGSLDSGKQGETMKLAALWILALGVLLPRPATASGVASGPWPTSSDRPVEALAHPSLESRIETLGDDMAAGFRLVLFGDQRALADGEWQAMIDLILHRERRESPEGPLLAVIDTGDIVFDGRRSDQFHMLTDILSPLAEFPYLVGVGNHEVKNNLDPVARENYLAFVNASLGDELSTDRLYFRRDVGAVRMLFLDSNDLVYGADGERADDVEADARAREQLRWLSEQLAEPEGQRRTLAFIHHPMLSSSKKHAAQGAKLWSLLHEGRTLPTILLEGGVDVVVSGHTHTYERLRVTDASGHSLQLINVSGRPRNAVLWFGSGGRRARDIRGEEIEDLVDRGWKGLEGWKVEHLDAMLDDEENQWAELRVSAGGEIRGEIYFLVDHGKDGFRGGGEFRLD